MTEPEMTTTKTAAFNCTCDPANPCRTMRMTVHQFEVLGGEEWSQRFRVRVGLRAGQLHRQIFGKPAKKVRSKAESRNKVGNYPCGILEQAFRLRGCAF